MNTIWLERDGLRLHAVEQGQGDCVLLLHGGMGDHRAVMPYLLPLSKRFRVLAPDLRGSGRSWCGGSLGFDQFTGDLEALLDHVGVQKVVIIGVSSGTGVAIHFALAHPGRLAGFAAIHPVYAGEEQGYTPEQAGIFAWMDGIASQALDKGIEALRPLYAAAPEQFREQAMAMAMEFDAASVVATSHLLVSGAQPFRKLEDLGRIRVPSLLVKGADPMHPAALSDAYLRTLPDVEALEPQDVALSDKLASFCASCFRASRT